MRIPLRPALAITAVSLVALGAVALSAVTQAQEAERADREVSATQPDWVDTGVTLAQGDSAVVSAFGRSSWDGGLTHSGPDGIIVESCAPAVPGMPLGALLVRSGEGAPLLAPDARLTGPGRINLLYNDCPSQYFDNTGAYTASISVRRAPVVAPPVPVATVAPAVEAPPPVATKEPAAGGGVPWLVLLGLGAALGGLGTAGYFVLPALVGGTVRFNPSARLESTAWLAPMRLRDLQGERRPKRALTVGGPDADINFGVEGIRARLLPLADGGTRLEMTDSGPRIFVNDMPMIVGRRLSSGQRVRIGTREFIFMEERDPHAVPPPRRGAAGALDKPDPRAA